MGRLQRTGLSTGERTWVNNDGGDLVDFVEYYSNGKPTQLGGLHEWVLPIGHESSTSEIFTYKKYPCDNLYTLKEPGLRIHAGNPAAIPVDDPFTFALGGALRNGISKGIGFFFTDQLAMKASGGNMTQRFANVMKGWITKDTYKQLQNIDNKLLDDALRALERGPVAGKEGFAGIKALTGKGIDGYMYELKLTGQFGKYRVLGNVQQWTNQKGLTQPIIIFEKIITK